MLAILAIMIAVLTLIMGIFAAVIAIVGIFGFQTIREEVKKRAETVAEKTATCVAERIADKTLTDIRERAQASGLTDSQGISEGEMDTSGLQIGRTRATTDSALKGKEANP